MKKFLDVSAFVFSVGSQILTTFACIWFWHEIERLDNSLYPALDTQELHTGRIDGAEMRLNSLEETQSVLQQSVNDLDGFRMEVELEKANKRAKHETRK